MGCRKGLFIPSVNIYFVATTRALKLFCGRLQQALNRTEGKITCPLEKVYTMRRLAEEDSDDDYKIMSNERTFH